MTCQLRRNLGCPLGRMDGTGELNEIETDHDRSHLSASPNWWFGGSMFNQTEPKSHDARNNPWALESLGQKSASGMSVSKTNTCSG